jgi:hypothetical protein
MPAPNLQDNRWLFRPQGALNGAPGAPTPWTHFISKAGRTSQASFGYDPGGNMSTYVIRVAWLDTTDAIGAILVRPVRRELRP